jgi:lipopolysaccharide/colanic/teichoic acid biosynthesis glycosyltransferase
VATSYTRASFLRQPRAYSPVTIGADSAHPTVCSEEAFRAILTLERRRAERSRNPFILMLLDAHQENGTAKKILHEAMEVVASSTRETDALGWYKEGAILGVIFTEVGKDNSDLGSEILRAKIRTSLQEQLGSEIAGKIVISVHVFPEKWDGNHSNWVADSKLYPDLKSRAPQKKISHDVKRAMDIVGSAALLLLLFPVLAAIAAIIKLTSDGPVLFVQERLGRFGERFKCLKFRTMYVNNDPKIHQDYIQQYIEGNQAQKSDAEAPPVYKITSDPRVTPIGKFLRKSSLDEVPQFWNVLQGAMSLVGPRPPVPYEFEIYDVWHRRRVLEVKPGVTGLWQVSGRSRLTFDDMVRLDLQYCKSWSLWLDLKILLATPRAVFSGEGAY